MVANRTITRRVDFDDWTVAARQLAQAMQMRRLIVAVERTQPVAFDRYVDSVNGLDTNDGLTMNTPFQTLTKINGLGAAMLNLKIGCAYGSVFTAAFTVPANGMTFGAWGNPIRGKPRIAPSAATAVTDLKVGTVWQDIKIDTFTNFGLLIQPAAGSAGAAVRRMTIVGPNAAGNAQGINLSNWEGGVIEDCNIYDCRNGTDYPSGAGTGIKLTGVDGLEIRYNRIADCYEGLTTNTSASSHRDLFIHHNRVLRSKVNGISMYSGVSGRGPFLAHNFVYHSPSAAGAAGHGIVSQNAVVGPVWRNNLVVTDYAGTPTNVQLYCLSPAPGSLPGTDVDYNAGYVFPGSSCSYGKLNTTVYATFAQWQAALAAAGFAGNEAHGVNADPLIADLANEDFTLLPTSPLIQAGAVLGYPAEWYVGAAPDIGLFELIA